MDPIMNYTNDTSDATSADPFAANNPLEDRIFGAILVLYAMAMVGPYMACLWVFHTDPEMSGRACYKIIFHIGVADVIQGISNGIAGGMFSILRTAPDEANKRIGSVLEGSWMAYSALVNLLAFNRFIQVCFSARANYIFTKRGTNLFIGICWLYGIAAFVVYNTDHVNVIYYVDSYIWGYALDEKSQIMSYVEEALDLFQLLCMIVWYIGIFVRLRLQTKSMTTNKGNINKKELHVVIQSLLICCLIFATCFGFFVVPIITAFNRYALFVCNLIWLTNCGCNPIIYMAFNATLRRKIFGLFGKEVPMGATAAQPTGHMKAEPTNQPKRVTQGSVITVSHV